MSTPKPGSTVAPGMKADAVVAVSDQSQAIYDAWSLDPVWSDYVYYAYYAMYALTILPSVSAMPLIYLFKFFTNVYIAVDGVFKLLGLGLHPAKEAYIWTMGNWWFYSFRRWIVDYMLTPVHAFTQAIPFANWLLNLIPLFAYWANAMVF